MRMKVVLLQLVLLVPALLAAPEGQEAYDELSGAYKQGVDLALQQVNSYSKIQRYFFFYKTLAASEIESGFGVSFNYHNFYLKVTSCSRTDSDLGPRNCPFRNDKPLIDCAVCYKTLSGAIEKDPKPYIHCIHRPALTKDMKQKRQERCQQMTYSHGSPTLLAVKQ